MRKRPWVSYAKSYSADPTPAGALGDARCRIFLSHFGLWPGGCKATKMGHTSDTFSSTLNQSAVLPRRRRWIFDVCVFSPSGFESIDQRFWPSFIMQFVFAFAGKSPLEKKVRRCHHRSLCSLFFSPCGSKHRSDFCASWRVALSCALRVSYCLLCDCASTCHDADTQQGGGRQHERIGEPKEGPQITCFATCVVCT